MREFSGKNWLKSRPSIFMRGLGKDCIVKGLREQFNYYGVIVDIHIPRVRSEVRGFTFVQFKHKEDVDHLLKVNPEMRVRGKTVSFARARKVSVLMWLGIKVKLFWIVQLVKVVCSIRSLEFPWMGLASRSGRL